MFSVSVRSVMRIYTARKRQRRYGTAMRIRITETDTDEQKCNAGNHALESVETLHIVVFSSV